MVNIACSQLGLPFSPCRLNVGLRHPGVVAYLGGIATSVLTIFAVKWGNLNDF